MEAAGRTNNSAMRARAGQARRAVSRNDEVPFLDSYRGRGSPGCSATGRPGLSVPEELANPLSPHGSSGNRQHGACYGGERQGHSQGEQEVNTQEADIRGMEILDDENDRDYGDYGGAGEPRVTAGDLQRLLSGHGTRLRGAGWVGSGEGRERAISTRGAGFDRVKCR